MGGNKEGHDKMVSDSARELASRDVDLIVLAQASMSRFAEKLAEETGLPVLASPRLGVEGLARIVHPEAEAAAK